MHERGFRMAALSGCWAVGLALGQTDTRAPAARFTPLPADVQTTDIVIPGIWFGETDPLVGGRLFGGCEQLSTHTDASFEGGQYLAQGGLAEGEIAAAEYVIPASAFPIQIINAEMIFATSGATVATTTEWSVLFWQGQPDTGTQVAEFSSDDKILPHIRLGIGTNGALVSFGIDPSDPEQIIINGSPTNSFTVGFRIDRHNQQTANPCFIAPPSCCNAYPVTDTGPLNQPMRNWLRAVNCGVLGCPSTTISPSIQPFLWTRMSALPLFCRPSGDWVLRVNWRSLDCQPGVGACCLPSGQCVVTTVQSCGTQQGTFRGDGTTCAGVTCPQPTGACCFVSTGACLDLTQPNCTAAGGLYRGNGTRCATTICFPRGACCLVDGACLGPVSPETCAAQGGTFRGDGTACATTFCPPPTGACCFSTGFCLELTQADCGSVGAAWGGAGSVCSNPIITDQPDSVAICGSGSATFSVTACSSGAPTYQWRRNGTEIAGATGSSLTINPATAADAGAYTVVVTVGAGSTTSNPAALSVGVRCDSNCDGSVDFDDIGAFVTALVSQSQWEAQHACGYLCANDADGSGVVTFDDIAPFVECLIGG